MGRAINGAEILMAWRGLSVVDASACPARASSRLAALLPARNIPFQSTPLSYGAGVPRLPSFEPASEAFSLFSLAGAALGGRTPLAEPISSFIFRTILKIGKSARDNGIARCDALPDNRLLLAFLHNLHISELCRIFWRGEINIASVRALLDGDRGHDNRVFERLELQLHIDELAGPEPVLIIREDAFDSNRAGGLIDLVVKDKKRPFTEQACARDGLQGHGALFLRPQGRPPPCSPAK